MNFSLDLLLSDAIFGQFFQGKIGLRLSNRRAVYVTVKK